MAKETIITISEKTGFSVSTVSRVLSNQAKKCRISDKTIEIITLEAQRCNYIPSMLAKSLRTNKTHAIGLLVPSIDNPFFANLASIVTLEAKNRGYTVILVDTLENEIDERKGLNSLLSRSVDGIIITPNGLNPTYLEEVNLLNTPIVLIDRFFSQTTLPYVTTNNYVGGRMATQILIDNGHKNICCIQGVPHSMPGRERVRGYRDALAESNIEANSQIVGDSFSIETGYFETKSAMSHLPCPTAIFALSNTILLGALKAIRELKLRIPEDVSIISFDDNKHLDFMNPAITRICQPSEDIGTMAVKCMVEKMESESASSPQIMLQPRVIMGNSIKMI